MKHNRVIVESALLSLVCTGGSLGCMVTAFQIPVSHPDVIGLAWLFWAVVCALVLRYRHGVWAAAAMALGVLAYAWMEGTVKRQMLGMLGSIARLYDAGYGWGIPAALQVELKDADIALCAMGAALILAVSLAVCRRSGTALAVIALVLPFLSCLVLTDTVPDVPSLFALMLGTVLLMLTAGVRLESGDQATRLCIAAALPTAIVLGLLFYFVPKTDYENKTEGLRHALATYLEQLPEKIQTGQITLPDFMREVNQVNLASLSAQPQLHIPVAEVNALKTGNVYLRRQDYDRYTGTSWQSTANRQETLAGIGEETGRVFVRMVNVQSCLLLPSFPDGETILADGVADNPENLWEYSFSCRSGLLGPQPGSAWLDLPEQTMLAARNILSGIPGDFSTTEAAAASIAAYVQNSAVYDRTTRAMPAGNLDFAIWFLEDAERGYCVHFATAAAVLLRSAGIPAR